MFICIYFGYYTRRIKFAKRSITLLDILLLKCHLETSFPFNEGTNILNIINVWINTTTAGPVFYHMEIQNNISNNITVCQKSSRDWPFIIGKWNNNILHDHFPHNILQPLKTNIFIQFAGMQGRIQNLFFRAL